LEKVCKNGILWKEVNKHSVGRYRIMPWDNEEGEKDHEGGGQTKRGAGRGNSLRKEVGKGDCLGGSRWLYLKISETREKELLVVGRTYESSRRQPSEKSLSGGREGIQPKTWG